MEEKDWEAIVKYAVQAYNTEYVHSATQTTPEEAREETNEAKVKQNLEQTPG